ncbi:LPS export ABC transporter periplasmic protein LptC [Desulfococcaceae bacterium HSG8]|nr:LPS export ABC transporter periplasmic protein LptC [Desulfococcaceae bacterium HSG8]
MTLGIIFSIFVNYRSELTENANHVPPAKDGSDISVSKVHHTSTKNGMKEWKLTADSADYIREKNQAVFQNLRVTFFLKDEKEVYLTADQGILKTDLNDIEMTGNIMVKSEGYMLETRILHYKHDSRLLLSEVPVKIKGATFDFSADSLSFDLKTDKVWFKGNVKGIFRGNISL